MMPITARSPIQGAQLLAASGRIGMAMLMNAYVPILSRMAARITEPTVGASVWASGSQVWNGNIGTLMANPTNMPANNHRAVPWAMADAASGRARMSNVLGSERKYTARKLTIISADPNRVNRKNLIA